MPKSANQKLKLLYLMQYLLQKSDEKHPISIQQMIDELARHDIKAERKTLYLPLIVRVTGSVNLKRSTCRSIPKRCSACSPARYKRCGFALKITLSVPLSIALAGTR